MERELNRRQTLIGLAVGAGALATGEAALAQGKYKEAPSLAELVKAGKLFDMMIYPMRKHDIGDHEATIHLYRTMLEFWKRNL